jgi:hypothetical protein
MRSMRSMRAMRPMRPAMPAMVIRRTMEIRPTMPAMPSMPSMPSMRSMPSVRDIDATTMRRVVGGMGVLAVGMSMARWMATRPRAARTSKDRAPMNRWILVTINCAPQRLASRADLPEPITRLGDAVDIKICPAPGDRGTELGARLRDVPRTKIAGMVMRHPEENPRHMVEEALREAKAIIEAGEVVRPDWPPSVQPVQGGKLLDFAGRRGGRP